MATSDDLRQIFTAGRPLIEEWLDIGEQIAALRDVAASKGLDWSQLKALMKAQIQDERDETGNGKRVARIVEKAEFASAYADMLGLANMNENNFSASQSYAEAKGVDRKARAKVRTSEAMDDNKAFSAELVAAGLISEEAHAENVAISDGVARKYGAGVIDPETGEITDTQEQPETANEIHERPSINAEAYPEAGLQAEASLAGTGTGTLAGHEGRSEGEAASVDLPTIPTSAVTPPSADKTGAAPLPSSAAPVAISDDDVPAFLKKDKQPNPKCQKPGNCKWDHGPVSCWRCNSAPASNRVPA